MKHTSKGTALPIVLLLAAMMLVTASAWLQASLVASRTALATRERVQAFHAADSALIRCARMASSAIPGNDPEPSLWRNKASFEGPSARAFQPFATWPYARRAPQCLVEAAAKSSFLVTARGFGATAESEAWLQVRIDENGNKHWRRIVARPF
jgi:Tfp pilus assembly protein PilX